MCEYSYNPSPATATICYPCCIFKCEYSNNPSPATATICYPCCIFKCDKCNNPSLSMMIQRCSIFNEVRFLSKSELMFPMSEFSPREICKGFPKVFLIKSYSNEKEQTCKIACLVLKNYILTL